MCVESRIESALDRFERTYGLPRGVAVGFNALGILICPVFGWLLAFQATHHAAYWMLVEKLGVVGFPYTLSFLVAAALAGALSWRARRRATERCVVRTYAGLAGFCFLVAMEHISWGQAIFNYPTPLGIGQVNTHGRFNLHNLPGLEELHSFFLLTCGIAGLIGLRLESVRFRGVAVPAILAPLIWVITIMSVLQIVTDIMLLPYVFSFSVFVLRYAIEFLIGLTCLLYVWLNGRLLRREWEGPGRQG